MKNLVFLLLLFAACQTEKVAPPAAVLPVPSARQLAWHELEYYGFVHFNMNTFSDMEWGMGDENPTQFNPTALDTRQWAKTVKDAGMKGIIITAKHHDGFCLWPSAYTEHTVKNSHWRDGKGDVIRELADACAEFGLKMGIYYSPWDRNHPEYGKPEYISYMRNQLRELLTNYGDIFYTINGSEPNMNSQRYEKPFLVNQPATLKAISIDPVTNKKSEILIVQLEVPKLKWKVIHQDQNAERTIDENPGTFWKADGNSLKVDLGEVIHIHGFHYLPPQNRYLSGIIDKYLFEGSLDGKSWETLAGGEFSNIANNPVLQEILFEGKPVRFIQLKALSTLDGEHPSFAELGIISNK